MYFIPRMLIYCIWWTQGKNIRSTAHRNFKFLSSLLSLFFLPHRSESPRQNTAKHKSLCPVPTQWILVQLWGPEVPLLVTYNGPWGRMPFVAGTWKPTWSSDTGTGLRMEILAETRFHFHHQWPLSLVLRILLPEACSPSEVQEKRHRVNPGRILVLPVTNCAALGRWFNLSDPQYLFSK